MSSKYITVKTIARFVQGGWDGGEDRDLLGRLENAAAAPSTPPASCPRI